MVYVQRDESNKVKGVFANPQPGYAEEHKPDDDPEVVEFFRETDVTNREK